MEEAAEDNEHERLRSKILSLQAALHLAKRKLREQSSVESGSGSSLTEDEQQHVFPSSSQHTLLLLADSALPLGSFAFSSGLESYLAHHVHQPHSQASQSRGAAFPAFLGLSVASMASTALPYVLEAYRQPESLIELDNDFDASTPCTVARRASVAQGRALLGVWERALRLTRPASEEAAVSTSKETSATTALEAFSTALKTPSSTDPDMPVNGHMAPLWGAVCRSQRLDQSDTGYVFLLNHAKAVASAAVRAAVLGPYAAQAMLASGWMRGVVQDAVEAGGKVRVEDAGQCVPMLDLWVGRHELLYSRIFNS